MRKLKLFSLFLSFMLMFSIFSLIVPAGANGGGVGNPGGSGNLAPGDANMFEDGILTNNFNLENNNILSAVESLNGITMSGGSTIGNSSNHFNVDANGAVTVSNGSGLYGSLAAQGNVSLSGGSNVMNSVLTMGTLYLGGGATVSGTVEAHQSIEIHDGNFPQAQSDSAITLDGGATVSGPVNAGGNLTLGTAATGGGATINGKPQTMGNLTFNNGGNRINGTAYVKGTTSPTYPSTQYTISGGAPQKLTSLASLNLSVPTIPSIPQPNLSWYSAKAQSQGHYFGSGQTIKLDSQAWNGVYYYNGNVTVSSSTPWDQTDPNFSGQAVIIASGTITFDSNQVVLPKTSQNSLVLISGGDMDVESNNHSANNTLFLYSGGNMNLLNNPLAQGALVCAGTLSIGNGSGLQFTQIMVSVTPGLGLTATGASLPAATVGVPYGSANITNFVTTSGGSGTGYSYSITSGLPPGLTFSNNVIAGAPATGDDSGSPYTITVKVTDSASNTATCTLSLAVNPAVSTGNIDTPANNQTIYGTAYAVSGWYVDTNGVKSIGVYIGGTYEGAATLGSPPADMPSQYSSYPSGDVYGFHFSLNTISLTNGGPYTLNILETDNNNKTHVLSRNLNFYVYQPYLS